MEQKRTEEKILKNKVSAYLNKRFNMKEYVVDEKHPANYLVRGSMLQYGEKVNVEVTVEKDGLTPVYWCITDQKLALPVRKIGKINFAAMQGQLMNQQSLTFMQRRNTCIYGYN